MDDKFYMAVTAWGTWAAVVCALFVVWRQNRASKQLANLQLFLQFVTQYESGDMQRRRVKLANQLLSEPTPLNIDDSVLMFFETVAHMTRRKFLDEDCVWNSFGVDIYCYWDAVHFYVLHLRERFSSPGLFEEMEALSNTFLKRAKELGLSRPAVAEFLRLECLRAEDLATPVALAGFTSSAETAGAMASTALHTLGAFDKASPDLQSRSTDTAGTESHTRIAPGEGRPHRCPSRRSGMCGSNDS